MAPVELVAIEQNDVAVRVELEGAAHQFYYMSLSDAAAKYGPGLPVPPEDTRAALEEHGWGTLDPTNGAEFLDGIRRVPAREPVEFGDGPWRFYDFENKWDEFWAAWKRPEVQAQLDDDMTRWCTYDLRGHQTWVQGGDLWPYARTDYHAQRMTVKANEYMREHRCVRKFRAAQARLGVRYAYDDDAAQAFVESGGWEEVERMFRPAPGTQEANVLMMGANYIARTHAYAAQALFPGEDVRIAIVDGHELAVVPGRKLIVDIQREWFGRVGGDGGGASVEELVRLLRLDEPGAEDWLFTVDEWPEEDDDVEDPEAVAEHSQRYG